jgi:hypothetical protein
MRLLSFILVILGLWLLCVAGYQQYRGVTTEPAILVEERLAGIVKDGEILKQRDPDDFRTAMTFHWLFGVVSTLSGIGLYLSVRRRERLDPFSPDFEMKDEE